MSQEQKTQVYLLRKGYRLITGPMTVAEISAGFHKMEIGLLDEVCGHAGPWVQFSSTEKLKQIYPAVASSVLSRMQFSESINKSQARKTEKVNIRFPEPKKTQKPPRNYSVVVVSILLIAGILLLLRLAIVNNLAAKSIPLQVAALPKVNNYFDFECQKNLIETKWAEAQPGGRTFASGMFTPKNPLLKILLWDPYWIVRHSQLQVSQMPPRSFFELCFTTIKSTLSSATLAGKERDFSRVVLDRVRMQMNILKGIPASTQNTEWTHPLQILNCYDTASSTGEFERCHQIQKKMDPDFQRILEDYQKFQLLRLGLSETKSDEALITILKRIIVDFPFDGALGRLDYRVELKKLKDLLNN